MLRVYYHVSCNKTDLSRCGNRRLYGRISSNVEKIFFLRRGAPLSITSDNSPTFALGDSILSECFQNVKDDPMVSKKISSRQIHWIYITPYAPWQGGAYERLIEIGSSQVYRESSPTREDLLTLLVEIEGMLNTRPLLYVESEFEKDRVLRPIDFLQNEFEVPPPLDTREEDVSDPTYLTLLIKQPFKQDCRLFRQ